jgi:hypothetical protein
MGIYLFLLGGFFNFYTIYQKWSHETEEEAPHKLSGYFAAFLGGMVTYGFGLWLCYRFILWIF